jgi:hypothetical protein
MVFGFVFSSAGSRSCLILPSKMDVINVISKVDGFPDAPIVYPGEFLQPGGPGYANGYAQIVQRASVPLQITLLF